MTHQRAKSFSKHWLVPVTALASSSILFYIYSYNSGYGFDALEYLVIARSLVHGYPFYAFTPSKSWGLYAFVAAAFRLGMPGTHAGVSALVALLFLATVVATWWVTKRLFGAGVALLNAVLVALCAAFMELNYLEPEPLVYLCGLAAFYILASANESGTELSPTRLLWAGFCGAVGCAFKVVAALYVLAIVLFVLMPTGKRPFDAKRAARNAMFVQLGFAIGFVPQLLYFVATGRGNQFITWTIVYPLIYYPRDNQDFFKLYTKLLWFSVLGGLCIVLALRKYLRMKLAGEPTLLLAGLMGTVSFVSLLKTQSSHYVFPGAAFLCLFVSWTIWMTTLEHAASKPRRTMVASTALACLIGIAVYTYSPRVLGRLMSWRDFAEERKLQQQLRSLVGPEQNLIALNHALQLYWLSGRYPPFSAIHTGPQTTWWLRNALHTYSDALQNTRVTLVEFNPANIQLDDPNAYAMGPWKPALEELREKLPKVFCTLGPPDAEGRLFWIRRRSTLGAFSAQENRPSQVLHGPCTCELSASALHSR